MSEIERDEESERLVPGQRYELRGVVGRGAMGVVHRAWDRVARREVALKTLRVWDPEDLYRLKKEFRSIADVTHPNLARLHELVSHDDVCFLTMELVHGRDFVGWSRAPGRSADELREALRQLAQGLDALHAAGLLHRDIKPTNVLVEAGGRVVILDFGLVSTARSSLSRVSRRGTFAGTPGYMAPEQIWGDAIGPAADWYGVGAVLYECLTGRLPIDPDDLAALGARRREAVPSARSRCPDAPEDLDALASALLRSDPAQRAGSAEVFALRPAASEAAPFASGGQTLGGVGPFVGRDRELAWLRDAYERSRLGKPVVARVSGPSGIGKTALVERFLDEVGTANEVLILRARCRFQESVRFNAVDGIVDELSRFLVHARPDRIEAMTPRNVRALLRMFPVLQRVPFAIPPTESDLADAEPHEVRRRAFTALRELLARISDRHPVILWVDDIQWGDADSAPILVEVLRSPDPPSLLALLTHRDGSDEYSHFLDRLEAEEREGAFVGVDRLAVGSLGGDAVRELVTALLADAPVEVVEAAKRAAAHASGSPFLLGELTRALRGAAATDEAVARAASTEFAEIVRGRVASLEPTQQRMLELVCVAGAPLDGRVLAEASDVADDPLGLVDELRRASLLRLVATASEPLVETYHDRIRESVLGGLDEVRRRDRHRALAGALEHDARTSPALLARHLHGAGEIVRAADEIERAGDLAVEALAFAQAADFYRLALDWKVGDVARTRSLLTRRARALVSAGRSAEAAPLFLVAAEGAEQNDAWELRREAAEKFLASGRTDEGVAILEPLLEEFGLRYPPTARAAVLSTLARVAELRLRGTRVRSPRVPPSSLDLTRIDLCYSVARGLITVDTMRAGHLPLVGLLLSLRAGEASRIGRSLAMVGGAVLAPLGGFMGAWGSRLIEQARSIANDLDDPYVSAAVNVSAGQVAVLRGEWRAAVDHSREGLRVLHERCRGVDWEKNTGHMAELRGLEEIGEMGEVYRRANELHLEAEALDDRYGAVVAALHIATSGVAVDRSAEARERLRIALERWSREGFLLQHLYAVRAEIYADLYDGRPDEAWRRVCVAWPEIERAFFLRTPITRIDSRLMRARAALALAADGGKEAETLLRACESEAALLAKERRPDTTAHAAALRGGVAFQRGDRESARSRLDDAVAAYERAGMELARACVRRRIETLREGPEDRERNVDADAALTAAGIVAPERWLRVGVPGFP
ncbi:MAG: AAA family ATPase [Myxococcota bacterium]|nr:AAA family ATPase [Myxococcota bacterium]